MVCSFEKVALYSPVITSCVPFALRRTQRGIDAMDDNPFFGIANIIIAGGQTLKAARAAKDLTFAQTQSAAETIKAVNTAAKGLHTSSKFLKFLGKVFDFTSKHINPLICCASAIKVLGADDTEDALLREGLALGGMFGMEAIGKPILAMPKYVVENGVVKTVPREAWYRKSPFVEKQVKAVEDYCQTKKLFDKIPLKSVPGTVRGLAFVFLFSVLGYKLGGKVADLILGKEESKNSGSGQCMYVQMDNSGIQAPVSVQAA